MRWRAVLLLLAFVLPGCASRSPSPAAIAPARTTAAIASATAAPQPTARNVTVLDVSGTITQLAWGESDDSGSVCCVGGDAQGDHIRGAFSLPPGATRLFAKLAWSDPVYDLDLQVSAPDWRLITPGTGENGPFQGADGHAYWDHDGNVGAPDSPAHLEANDTAVLAVPGDWRWNVTGRPAKDVAFRLAVRALVAAAPAP